VDLLVALLYPVSQGEDPHRRSFYPTCRSLLSAPSYLGAGRLVARYCLPTCVVAFLSLRSPISSTTSTPVACGVVLRFSRIRASR
jgi:hypothetical protein